MKQTKSEPSSSQVIACVPGGIPADERDAHFALLSRLLKEDVRERLGSPDGYAFRFDSENFDDIARYVSNERKCCPFLNFVIEVASDGGPLWLRLTGPSGTREFLDAAMPAIR
ncbi:MAG: hypothetical protein WKF55_07205 [Gemmatimonadaceae bacterium]